MRIVHEISKWCFEWSRRGVRRQWVRTWQEDRHLYEGEEKRVPSEFWFSSSLLPMPTYSFFLANSGVSKRRVKPLTQSIPSDSLNQCPSLAIHAENYSSGVLLHSTMLFSPTGAPPTVSLLRNLLLSWSGVGLKTVEERMVGTRG